jgi:hypothetical protein
VIAFVLFFPFPFPPIVDPECATYPSWNVNLVCVFRKLKLRMWTLAKLLRRSFARASFDGLQDFDENPISQQPVTKTTIRELRWKLIQLKQSMKQIKSDESTILSDSRLPNCLLESEVSYFATTHCKMTNGSCGWLKTAVFFLLLFSPNLRVQGFRLALESLEGECAFASELNESACDCYEANFGDR